MAALWTAGIPFPSAAQRPARVYRVGAPMIAPRRAIQELLDAFEAGLREHGLVPGRNIAIEYRFTDNKPELLPRMYAEMVRSKVDLIVTGVNLQTLAAKEATHSIPIVMILGKDVVERGFVASYARPGGNITGLTWEMGDGATVKRLEHLKALAPGISRVAVLFDPPYGDPGTSGRQALEAAAAQLRWRLSWTDISDDFQRGFAAALTDRPDALLWLGGARQRSRAAEAVALSAKHRLPASYHDPAFVHAGGLVSYGPNVHDLFRRAGRYVDSILKGANPAELAVEQPTKYELIVNRRAASALGISIPQPLLVSADRVIE
ncbi:MAG: ABC transporter substrate-binding protein [Burkholderiales bacterium]